MPECVVQIVRTAFKEMQKLPYQNLEDAANVIRDISEGELGDHRKLQGYENLWRTAKGDVRVIWKKNGFNSTLIIKVGLRKEVYKNISENQNTTNLLKVSDVLKIKEDRILDIPSYEWDKTSKASWYQFIYGGYLYSPVLTKSQREVFEIKIPWTYLHKDEISSFSLQSSPGTGKTVCAALIACEFFDNYQWNVALILPKTLCKEVKEFANIKVILQQEHDNFFVGEFEEWIAYIAPSFYPEIASKDEELNALETQAKKTHTIQDEVTLQDLMLYRSFIYNGNEQKISSHPIYIDNKDRINQLRGIDQQKWKDRLKLQGKKPWLDSLEVLANELPLPQQNKSGTSIVIFDETQDYLLSELKSIINMLNRWQKQGHSVLLYLLGDMNQRIQPVDFNWGSLELGTPRTLKYNYRNTGKILEFANAFHTFAQKRGDIKGKHLPEVCNPNDTFEVGEPVRILEVSSVEEGLVFLEKLNEKIKQQSNNSGECSLLKKLSNRVTVIYMRLPENNNLDGIDYLSIEQSKGREFDACITFCIFDGTGNPTFEESNKWYTTFTRPRYRLLVISTTAEICRIGGDFFKMCDFFSPEDTDRLINWISEYSNSEFLFRDYNTIYNLLDEGMNAQPLQIYWDTYPALRLAKFSDDQINEVETRLIEQLRNQSIEFRLNELSQIDQIRDAVDRVPLKCLILRSLSRSWEAFNEASLIENDQPQEYKRLLNAIASDLESQNLVYEATRLKAIIGIPLPEDYPFRESLEKHPSWLRNSNFVSLLCNLTIDKITSKISN